MHVSRADANLVAIAAAGGIAPLVQLLGSPAADVQGAAAGALANLAENGACKLFVQNVAAVLVRECATAAIMCVATSLPGGVSRADENKVTIVAAGAIAPLVQLLGSPAPGGQQAAAGALCNLAGNGACKLYVCGA